jgi:hypothetical protein
VSSFFPFKFNFNGVKLCTDRVRRNGEVCFPCFFFSNYQTINTTHHKPAGMVCIGAGTGVRFLTLVGWEFRTRYVSSDYSLMFPFLNSSQICCGDDRVGSGQCCRGFQSKKRKVSSIASNSNDPCIATSRPSTGTLPKYVHYNTVSQLLSQQLKANPFSNTTEQEELD